MPGPIHTIVGARPNFMKAAPVHHAFKALGVDHHIIHTGQHYDDAMSKVFFDDLGMPKPSVYLGVGSASHAVQTANVMIGLEKVFLEHKPRMVLVVGDVNSTMGAAIVASKLLIPVGHIEAGLRSRDWTMPEEVNRAVTDVISNLLLTPSPDADANLLQEGRDPKSIVCVGNVMIDTLLAHRERARELDTLSRLGLEPGRYAVLTLHRPSNVDSPDQLRRLFGVLSRLGDRLPVVFPVHPRTRNAIEKNLQSERLNLRMTEPLGYLEFLRLLMEAQMVLTDSGGIQEETTALGVPCLTLRDSTERPVTVSEGTNTIVGTDPRAIEDAIEKQLSSPPLVGRRPALWDGQAAVRIIEILERDLRQGLGSSPQ